MRQKPKTQNVTKLKNQIVTKYNKIKMLQKSKTKTMTKLKLNCDKTPKLQIVTVIIVTVVTVAVVTVVIVTSFRKDNLTPQQPMNVLGAAFRDSRDVFG